MIKQISNSIAKKYIDLDSMLIYTPEATHYGYFEDNEMLGIIAVKKIRNTYRIKSLYVLPDYRKRGVGNKLIGYLVKDEYDYDCYATTHSYNLFHKNGFEPVKEYKNKVTYMKRPKK
jgi:N-acetylglutamate synthase-like GNAT family acetyltransferase